MIAIELDEPRVSFTRVSSTYEVPRKQLDWLIGELEPAGLLRGFRGDRELDVGVVG